jgi:poly(A)-specific ribonuclease
MSEDMLELDTGHLDRYLLHHELRRRFPDRLWTFDDDEGVFVVVAVSSIDRTELELDEPDTELASRYVDSRCGFAKIMAALSAADRPLVGHNCATDLQLLFGQFVGPPPWDYAEYKQQLHDWLPVLFDTKHMAAAEAKRRPRRLESGANLERLYTALTKDSTETARPWPPTVQLAKECSRYISSHSSVHEGGVAV